MHKIFLFLILILFSVIPGKYALSQNATLSKVNTANGLLTADFMTAEGIFTIYLPADMTVAETASGTVALKGSSDQSSINRIFTNYSLVAESQVIPVNGNNFTLQVPVNLPTGVLSISLKDQNGKILNRAFFPVRLTKRSQLPGGSENFRTPLTSRAGMPAIVNGPFDGNSQNSSITISGQPVTILSESTRQLVFFIPEGLQGQKVLSLREGATEFKTPFTVLYVVKVGRDNPVFTSRKDGTPVQKPPSSSGGVLIESEEQFGKINLENNSKLEETAAIETSAAPNKRRLTPTEEPSLGPSINDLSKPLEIDPDDLKKYSSPVIEIPKNNQNELAGLKQFSDSKKEKLNTEKTDGLVSISSPSPTAGTTSSSYADINEVKDLLNKQLSSPFTPHEDSKATKKADNLTAKNIKEEKPVPEKSEKKIKSVDTKKEVKPVTTVENIDAKPIPPKIVSTNKTPVKEDVQKNNSKEKAKASVTPPTNILPVANTSSKKTEIKSTLNPEEKNTANTKVKAVKQKNDTIKDTKNTKADKEDKDVSSASDKKAKFRKINDLSSLNTKNGSYGVEQKNISSDKSGNKNGEEGIKEKEYVSLKKKEPAKPQIQPDSSKGKFVIQLASFKKKSEASELVGKLNEAGYDVYYKRFKVPGKGYWYRIRKGGFSSRNEAEAYKNSLNLTKYHITSFFVTTE